MPYDSRDIGILGLYQGDRERDPLNYLPSAGHNRAQVTAMESPPLLPISRVIERKYHLLEQLRNGSGYYGVTWLAQDVVNKKKACIKVCKGRSS